MTIPPAGFFCDEDWARPKGSGICEYAPSLDDAIAFDYDGPELKPKYADRLAFVDEGISDWPKRGDPRLVTFPNFGCVAHQQKTLNAEKARRR